MLEAFVVVIVVLAVAVFLLARRTHRRDAALARVAGDAVDEGEAVRSRRVRSVLVRHRWLPIVLAISAALIFRLVGGAAFWLSLAFAFVLGSLLWILEEFLHGRRELRVEEQVADAIDLIVSALRAGTGLVDALSIAAGEARQPTRRALDEVVTRLRLGDTPEVVFADFARRIPLESAELFSFTVGVHWNVGGSLTPALATVGQSTRHRIEFSRRVRSQAMEGRASVVGVLAITYLLAFLMWKAYPQRFDLFLKSSIGVGLTATVVFLEGIGLVWMSFLTRVKS